MRHHALIIFIFLIETGFCHVDQADLELLISRVSPTSASQSVGITAVSHHAWLFLLLLLRPILPLSSRLEYSEVIIAQTIYD